MGVSKVLVEPKDIFAIKKMSQLSSVVSKVVQLSRITSSRWLIFQKKYPF